MGRRSTRRRNARRGKAKAEGRLPETTVNHRLQRAVEPTEALDDATGSRIVAVRAEFRGPLPPPSILRAYKEAGPDIPERIVRMAERQAEGRIKVARLEAEADVRLEGQGQIFAFVLALSLLVLAGFLVHAGRTEFAVTVFLTDALGLVGMFLLSRRDRMRPGNSTTARD